MDMFEALNRWRIVRRKAPRTYESYHYSLARMSRFGLRRVEDVTLKIVSDYVVCRMESVSPETMKAELAALYSPLTMLMKSGEFPLELLRQIRQLAPEVKKPRRLSAPHLSRVQFEVLARGAVTPDAEFMIRCDTLSGMRAGELARTRWEEHDLSADPTVRVRLVPELGQAGRIKTGEERSVPICAELKALLVARRDAIGCAKGYLLPNGRPTLRHELSTVKRLRRDLIAARERVGLGWVTFHILRHTRASWWVQGGTPMAKVARWLGNTIEVCERYYAGLREGYDPDCERMPA